MNRGGLPGRTPAGAATALGRYKAQYLMHLSTRRRLKPARPADLDQPHAADLTLTFGPAAWKLGSAVQGMRRPFD